MARYSSATDALMAYSGYNENNADQNAALAAFIKQNAGLNINPASTAWCAAVLNAALGASGVQGTGKLNARSFLNWGIPVDQPQPGDVVVFSRGPAGSGLGHTGIYMGSNPDGTIRVLSGNHADAVGVDNFSTSNLLGYRRADPNAASAALSGNASDPVSAYAAVQVLDGNAYKVRGGDTLNRIAQVTGIPAQELAAFNGIENMDRIFAGQSLKLPQSALTAINDNFGNGSVHSSDPMALVMQGMNGQTGMPQIPQFPSLPALVPNMATGTPPGTQLGLASNAPPPIPMQRPSPLTPSGLLPAASTGMTYQVGDLVPSRDGSYKLRVEDDGTGHAKFVRQLNPGEVPGVFDPYKAVGSDKTPSLLGDFINSRPDIAGPLQMAKGLGLTANQAAQLAANPPKISAAPVQQAVQNAAGATQSTVGNAVKQGTSALGDFGNSAVNMLGGLFNSAPKAPPPPASIPSAPANSGWATAWHASPMPVQAPPTPSYVPTMPTGGPGTFPAAGLPAAPYMPTMPTGGPGTYGPAGMPAAPILPMAPASLTPQIGTPPGTQLHMTVNRVPSPPPVQMVQIASGKRVPVGAVTPHGGVVQSNGSINHGSWSTPGPGQDLKWWQANSMGYTV